MKYFIDTSFFIAIANKKDKFHREVKFKVKELKKDSDLILFTSDYVINELMMLLMRILGMEKAITWLTSLLEGKFGNIFYCNKDIFEKSSTIFISELNERKPLTLTDCVVYVSSNILECKEILTYDERLLNYKN